MVQGQKLFSDYLILSEFMGTVNIVDEFLLAGEYRSKLLAAIRQKRDSIFNHNGC